MLIDDVNIKVAAGDGGKGAVAFNKNLMSLGPAGGDGGDGGSVYLEGVSDFSALNQFRFKKELEAKNGMDGRGQFMDGKDAEDLVLKVPVGTIVHNLTTEVDEEITKIGEVKMIAKGGHGGKGNFKFRSPVLTSPKISQPGRPGEKFEFRLELKLIADIGLIGLPNAGKSSLLNALTAANAKVANYAFTTLEPNLGVYYDLVISDIPGLIEGASSGKGLGIKFLRHVERTTNLFHLISAESDDPARDYRIIRDELKSYNPALLKKPETVFISKSDMIDKDDVNRMIAELKKIKVKAIAISVIDDESMTLVKKELENIDKLKRA